MSRVTRSAVLVINKLEAARRQIDAAIRMTFDNEDELAIHTVAAAGYRILREILAKRGRHDLEELLRIGVYSWSESLAHGKLSDNELKYLKSLEPPWVFDLVSNVADAIRLNGEKITPDDVPAFLGQEGKIQHYRSMSQTADFLKHADRDPKATLSLKDVNNSELILHASVAYYLVAHSVTPEMVFFNIYSCTPDRRANLATDQREIAEHLDGLSPAKRRAACAKFIRMSKR